MKTTHIPFEKTGFFSKMMADYLSKKEILKPFYNNFPDLDAFKKQIEEKRNSKLVSKENRKILADALQVQNSKLPKMTFLCAIQVFQPRLSPVARRPF